MCEMRKEEDQSSEKKREKTRTNEMNNVFVCEKQKIESLKPIIILSKFRYGASCIHSIERPKVNFIEQKMDNMKWLHCMPDDQES